jgi:hypothetical protein
MNTVSMVLASLLCLALVVMMMPSVAAMNRGKTLRNIALWLAIVLAIGLVYQHFGPGKAALTVTESTAQPADDDKAAEPADNQAPATGDDNQSYTPPRE